LMRTGQIVALDTPALLKQAVFPGQLYELEPRGKADYARLQELRRDPDIDYFEAYGLRYHAAFRATAAARLKSRLEQDFQVREIVPTLEDVFLRIVEGDNP